MRRVALYVLLVGLLVNGVLVGTSVVYSQRHLSTDVLAFVSWRDGFGTIHLIDTATAHLVHFQKSNLATTTSAHWSSDGDSLLFESGFRNTFQVATLPYPRYEAVEALRTRTNDPFNAARSPDDSTVAFIRWIEVYVEEAEQGYVSRLQSDIYLMDTVGGSITELTRHPTDEMNPNWSPDGRQIAFESRRDGNLEIYAVNVDGSNLRNLTNSPTNEAAPVWSPDGSRIAFQGSQYGFDIDLYTMDVDGANVQNLTRNATANFSPVWSPDGTRIAFVSRQDGDYEIYVTQADGTSPLNLSNHPAPDSNPVWSPDGTQIAFVSRRDGNEELYTVEVASGELRRLTNHPAPDLLPAWRP